MAVLKYRIGGTLDPDQILSWGAKITKKEIRKPNVLKFQVLQTNVPKLNDEVLYYDLANSQKFGGYIQKITDMDGVQNIDVSDYSIKLSQEKFTAIYEGVSPESIVESIINDYTDFTYVSSVSTGITISKMVFQDEWIIDGLNKLLELFNGSYNVDLSKNFNMGILGNTVSTRDILRGRDKLDGSWATDINKKAEKVIVLGSVIDQRTTEVLSGTGTEFTTAYTPENVEITGLQQTTEDIDGDYLVDVQNKKITFNTSKTDPAVSYTYKSQIRVEFGTGKTIILEKKYIESKLEARKLAIEYRNRFSDGVQSAKWIKPSDEIDLFNVGDSIYVGDDQNNKSGYYTITSVVLELPKTMKISVGETDDNLFDWQKETIERIKQLEKKNTNADYVTLYDYVTDTVNVNIKIEYTKLETITNSGEILWASETELATDGDLISDDGNDEDFALAYDDSAIPSNLKQDYL